MNQRDIAAGIMETAYPAELVRFVCPARRGERRDPLDPRQRGVIPKDYVRDYRPALERGVEGVKIGLIEEGFEDLGFPASEKVVAEKVRAAARPLESLGAGVSEVSIPMHGIAPYIFRGIIL